MTQTGPRSIGIANEPNGSHRFPTVSQIISRAQQPLAQDRRSAIIVPANIPNPGNSGEAHLLAGSSTGINL